jgi:hypothetical protein
MDVPTIYKDKLNGKYKFMFDRKEKQKCLITNIMERKKLNWYFSYWIRWEKCMFPNGVFASRCNLRWKHIGLVISPLKSLMIDQCKQTKHVFAVYK